MTRVVGFFLCTLILVVGGSVGASSKSAETVTVPIIAIDYLAEAEELRAKVLYRTGCLKPWAELKGVDSKELVIVHMAEVHPGHCTLALGFNWVSFDTKNIPAGTYAVIDGHNGGELGTLNVRDEFIDNKTTE